MTGPERTRAQAEIGPDVLPPRVYVAVAIAAVAWMALLWLWTSVWHVPNEAGR